MSARLLIVDDEAAQMKALCRTLEEEHYSVTGFTSATQALEVLRRQEFDLLLTDLQMPDMSGMDLYAEVQRRFPGVAERFVFVTGGAFSPEAKRFLEEVAPSVIHKPFRIEEVLDLIEQQAVSAGPPERARVAPRAVS